MTSPTDDFINQRLTRIEDLQTDQQKELATAVGTLTSLATDVKSLRESIDRLSSSSDKSSLLQKVLMGSIIVQSLLHGVTTPEAAKAAISQIFGGN